MLRYSLPLVIASLALAQVPKTNVESGKRYARIVIRGATVVDGSGTPASGPKEIVIENNMITDVVSADGGRGGRRTAGDINIDASITWSGTTVEGSVRLIDSY